MFYDEEVLHEIYWFKHYFNNSYTGSEFASSCKCIQAHGFPEENDESEDCGIYMLKGIEVLLNEEIPRWKKKNIGTFRSVTLKKIIEKLTEL